jgi:hypothetical protein
MEDLEHADIAFLASVQTSRLKRHSGVFFFGDSDFADIEYRFPSRCGRWALRMEPVADKTLSYVHGTVECSLLPDYGRLEELIYEVVSVTSMSTAHFFFFYHRSTFAGGKQPLMLSNS